MRKTLHETVLRISIVLAIFSIWSSYLILHELKQGLFFAVMYLCVGIVAAYWKPCSSERLYVVYGVYWALSVVVIPAISQFILNESLINLGVRRIILEAILYTLIYSGMLAITLNMKVTLSSVSLISAILSIANYYVYEFRGTELQPSDIFAIRTASNVAGGYRIIIEPTVLYGLNFTALYLLLLVCLPTLKIRRRKLTRICALCAIGASIWLFSYISKPVHAQYFLQTGSAVNGYMVNFALQTISVKVQKPTGYSLERVEEIEEKYSKDIQVTATSESPDIIVIMDESYADLGRVGEKLRTNIEVTPYIDSLKENTCKGYTLSSVFGGGTPNSEYEFLTGNSMLFLPEGSFAYSQFLEEPTYSMVSELRSRGYYSIGMHPGKATGWDRDKVYPMLGFDETYFIEAFEGYDTLRNLTSDQGMFQKIEEVYEEKIEMDGKPIFLFGVTMQNHGGYNYEGSDFEPDIKLQGYSKEYPDVEQYLSLLHETDAAVEELIKYFTSVERDVVLLFYGDHFPRIDENFYQEVHGGSFTGLDEEMLRYEVPFFIWTNYKSISEESELVSMNYLSHLVYEKAGI